VVILDIKIDHVAIAEGVGTSSPPAEDCRRKTWPAEPVTIRPDRALGRKTD
jgi:hypothetical protein